MRTIKFRGKQIDGGEWLYGDLVRYNICTGKNNGCAIYPHDKYFGDKVIPESVGQYTGYYDKDGKEIYEGIL